MIDDYIANISNIGIQVLFFLFKYIVIGLTIILIILLLMLIIGCLIKSQKLKIKALKSSLSVFIALIIILGIPIIIYYIKI